MAFENVNVSSLRSAIKNCKATLKYENSKTINYNLSSDGAWSASAKNTLKEAMEKLIEKNQKLEEQLNKGLSMATYIENYQNLQSENKEIDREIRSLERDLRHEDDDTSKIERKIDKLERKRNENLNKMSKLVSRINQYI